MTIFIVDDEPKIRNGMGKLLSAHPRWQVQTFADAKSALHRLYEGEADVIITDIQMPDVSGLDMIESVRQVNKTVPILILSGYSRFDYAQRAIESGVRKYLTKPTDPVDLIAALEQIEREQCEQIQRLQRQAQKEPDLKPVDNLLVLRAIEYLQAHYAERIGLAQTAQALYISPNYLSELFRKTTGMRFTEYQPQLRHALHGVSAAAAAGQIARVPVRRSLSCFRRYADGRVSGRTVFLHLLQKALPSDADGISKPLCGQPYAGQLRGTIKIDKLRGIFLYIIIYCAEETVKNKKNR